MFGKKGASKPQSSQKPAVKAKPSVELEALPQEEVKEQEAEEVEDVSEPKKPSSKKTKSEETKKKSVASSMPDIADISAAISSDEAEEGRKTDARKKDKKSSDKSPKTNVDDPFSSMEGHKASEDEAGHEESLTGLRLKRARNRIWLDLRDGIDLKALANMEAKLAREEVASAVEEIARFRNLDLTPAELQSIAKECADDMLGFGPLEELLARDDIADIMINGPDTTYIEVKGRIEKTKIKFRDNQHLTTICQRIVGAIGRRVDEASPICDARLPDGSRVNVIIPPLAVDGACMTIRKFTKDKLTLEKLLEFGSMTPSCAKLIMAIGRCRVNVLVSGGTGSGKTTMLNCLTRYIESGERIVTCEDACELQLQQPHVVRLETRPPNLEGVGEVTMRDLVKNCLRMRPERIIVGEVRGPEAFDLLQAMNTGHDGSMGTVHANNPREAISRMENMIAMGGLNLPTVAVREQIASAVNVIIQVQRLRDGSRKTTHVTEVTGMEGEVVTMQDLFHLEIQGEDDDGKLITRQKSTGLRPKFFDNARQFGVDQLVMDAMEEAFD
ncbi:MAG: CpaF family protein [Alphaproteobacteria bacterium]|nr:CpaF family protein [Alphaproteobacteria bacterium]